MNGPTLEALIEFAKEICKHRKSPAELDWTIENLWCYLINTGVITVD